MPWKISQFSDGKRSAFRQVQAVGRGVLEHAWESRTQETQKSLRNQEQWTELGRGEADKGLQAAGAEFEGLERRGGVNGRGLLLGTQK